MGIVVAALLPVFVLIVLKRTLMRLETQWHGPERLPITCCFRCF